MRLIVSREAARDLDGISLWTFEAFGPRQAKLYVAKIEAGFERLLQGDAMSRPADDVSPGLRRLRVDAHVIYLRILEKGDLLVVRVLHGSQDVERHL